MATTKKYSDEVIARANNFVMDSVNQFDSQRQTIEDSWEKYDYAYRAMFKQTYQSYKGDSQYASPQIHDNIELIVGRIAEAVRISDKAINIETNRAQDEAKAEAYKKIAITQSEQQDIEDKKEILLRMLAKYGTAIVKVPWEHDKETLSTREVVASPVLDAEGNPIIDENGQPIAETDVETVERDITKYIGPGYQVIDDLADIYWDMFIENVQDQPIIVQRMITDWSTIKEGVDKGVYFSDTAKKIKDQPFLRDSTSLSSRSENVLGVSSTELVGTKGKPKEYEVFEAWCQFDFEGTGEGEPAVITIVNNQVLGLRKNPFWHKQYPFLVARYREVEGEAYGIGAIEPVINMWYDFNDILNQVNDARMFLLNPVVIYQSSSIIDNQTFDVEPGAIWPERTPGAIRRFEQSLNEIVAGTNLMNETEQRINRGMGVTALQQGVGDLADLEDVTYRGTQKMINQADKKFRRIAKRFEYNLWRNWIEMGFKLNAQLLDEPLLFIEGIDPETGQPMEISIDMQQVVGEYNFSVTGVEYFFDLQDKLEKTINFSQLTAGKPYINGAELDLQIAEMMGLKNINKIFVPPPEEAPIMKPPSISINIDPSKGTTLGTVAAQILNQVGYNIDINQALDDSQIINDRTAPDTMIQSGLLPQGVEEDIIEDKPGVDIEKKVEVATGDKVGAEPEAKTETTATKKL